MMGRPSLAGKRRTEILDAFERCVARRGLEASSLEAVAEEAGLRRSLLRHYVGNREELVRALARRVVSKYESALEHHLEVTDASDPVAQLLSFLFPDQPQSTAEAVLVIESLIAAGSADEEVRDLMFGYVDSLVSKASKLLRSAFPAAAPRECWAVAYGVVSICFNQESLVTLQLPPRYLKAAKACAGTLIDSLEG